MMAQTFSTQLRNTMYFNAHKQDPPKRFTPPNLTCFATRVNILANADKANGTPIHTSTNATARHTDTLPPTKGASQSPTTE